MSVVELKHPYKEITYGAKFIAVDGSEIQIEGFVAHPAHGNMVELNAVTAEKIKYKNEYGIHAISLHSMLAYLGVCE